jgi:predicted RNase H-like HicB family nuclease
MQRMSKKLSVIIEKNDGELWGRIESPEFLLTTQGITESEIIENLKDLLVDFIENEGNEVETWKNINIENIEFDIVYDLTALFETFDALKISTVASLSGINKGLMRQYVSGVKHPSEKQAQKVQYALHQLGKQLLKVSIM